MFLFMNLNEINKARKQAILFRSIKDKFCAGIISNCNSNFRIKFIEKLNNYKKVDMGGNCYNNIGRKVKNKIKFLMDYKFSISMENSGGDGYITEKIVASFLAGTIPIYYGDFLVDEYIHYKWLKNIIDDEFELIIDEQNPDYLIYNVFGDNDINISFQNCIRIAIYTENVMPDLNSCRLCNRPLSY